MLYPLLLDAAPAAQGTPVTVYVTIGAAILAALASLNATRISAKTSREVASLASQTAKESARIAAETAREIKDTDYKHDFYKRIIERRLKAWEEAQSILSLLSDEIIDEKDGKRLHSYCTSGEKFDEVLNRIRPLFVSQLMWMSEDYVKEFARFHHKNTVMRKASLTLPGSNIIDDNLLAHNAKKNYDSLVAMVISLITKLHVELRGVPNVEKFLVRLSSSNPE